MYKLRHESGRTMLEMIGVLAIIGLLTVGSLTGYSYLVQRHRRQEVAREVAQLVMGIKASGAARKYGDGAVIPARDFVSGVGVKENPHVLKFADGENSYAVVTQLANGAFVVNLQLEPGTCETVLEALGTEDAVIFKPTVGEIKNAHQMEEESKRWLQATNIPGGKEEGKKFKAAKEDHKNKEKDPKLGVDIIAYCNEGSYVSWAEGCDPGDAAYGNIVSTTCHGCEAGSLLDVNGKCCPVSANNCGTKYCECPAGTMCNQETSECVECSTFGSQEKGNEQCKKIYDKFSKHVCRGATNSCVECLTSPDCSPTTGYSDSALYAGKDFHYCSDYKCVECNMDYNGKGADEKKKEFPCPTQTKPVCNKGTCEPCSEDEVWDDTKKECVCKNGKVKGADGTCALCIDNKTNYGLDSGCGEDPTKPMCMDDAMSEAYATGGTMKEGTQCVECVTDKNCEHNAEKKYCGKEYTCVKCDGAWDSVNRECRECQDDKSGEAKDKGCGRSPKWTDKKMCKPENDSTGNGTQAYGNGCWDCQNNKTDGSTDYGCGTGKWIDKPFCGTNEVNGYAEGCWDCQNNKTDGSTDYGCDTGKWTGKPFCGTNEVNGYADGCWDCQNNKTDGSTDYGCDTGKWVGKPLCGTNDVNGYADGCWACQDNTKQTKNSSGTVTPDYGCSQGKPICGTSDNGNGAFSNYGCVECLVNADCPDAKPVCDQTTFTCKSCPADKPIWDATQRKCVVCMDDKTGTTADTGCGSGTWAGKPICVVAGNKNNGSKLTGNSCIECYVNTDCPSSKPYCDTQAGYVCSTCTEVSQRRGLSPLRPYYVKNAEQDGCYVCIDDKTGTTTDSGCGAAGKTICGDVNTGSGKGANTCNCPENSVWDGSKCVECPLPTITGITIESAPNRHADQNIFSFTPPAGCKYTMTLTKQRASCMWWWYNGEFVADDAMYLERKNANGNWRELWKLDNGYCDEVPGTPCNSHIADGTKVDFDANGKKIRLRLWDCCANSGNAFGYCGHVKVELRK